MQLCALLRAFHLPFNAAPPFFTTQATTSCTLRCRTCSRAKKSSSWQRRKKLNGWQPREPITLTQTTTDKSTEKTLNCELWAINSPKETLHNSFCCDLPAAVCRRIQRLGSRNISPLAWVSSVDLLLAFEDSLVSVRLIRLTTLKIVALYYINSLSAFKLPNSGPSEPMSVSKKKRIPATSAHRQCIAHYSTTYTCIIST